MDAVRPPKGIQIMRVPTFAAALSLLAVPLLLIGMTLSRDSAPERSFWTPYSGLNWGAIEHHDMQIHVHPGLGAEEYNPHETVDRYLAEGFTILAFTPHDYDVPDDYIDNVYPWTRFSGIFETIRDVPNPTEDNRTYGEMTPEPWQDRDPIALGMVSVQGSEISGHHHINSLFSSFTTSGATEAESLEQIRELGGIAFFNHPGRHVERQGLTAEWYVDLYRRFDVLVGQSIYNRIDSHPGDREFFDEVAHAPGARSSHLALCRGRHAQRAHPGVEPERDPVGGLPARLPPPRPPRRVRPGREGCAGERDLLRVEALGAVQPPLLQPHRRPRGGRVGDPDRG
jgi:hypothetical protein